MAGSSKGGVIGLAAGLVSVSQVRAESDGVLLAMEAHLTPEAIVAVGLHASTDTILARITDETADLQVALTERRQEAEMLSRQLTELREQLLANDADAAATDEYEHALSLMSEIDAHVQVVAAELRAVAVAGIPG